MNEPKSGVVRLISRGKTVTPAVVRMEIMRTSSWALLWVGLSLCACGRKIEPPAEAPASPPEAAPAPATEFAEPAPPPPAAAAPGDSRNELESAQDKDSLSTAEAEFEQARAELDAALPVAKPQSPAAGAAAPSRSRATDAADEAPKPKAEKKSSENGCATACRAFASLGRAASAVCRLTGDADARCTRAKGILTDAERRVASCSCRTE